MLNVISVGLSVISMVCCIFCVLKSKEVREDRAEILNNWCKTIGDLERAVKLNDEIISYCKTLIKYNERLTDTNADLRLELNKMKEKEK